MITENPLRGFPLSRALPGSAATACHNPGQMPYRLRENVLRLAPYSPGKPIDEVKRELGLTDVVKLASNENPFGPSPRVTEALARAAGTLNLYPDASGHAVKEALGRHYGIGPAQIALGNGSDELIHLLALILLEGGLGNVVLGSPSFVRYEAAAGVADVAVKAVPLDRDYRHDLGAMAQAVDAETRLVFIANPHNPTGTAVGRDDLRRFLDRLPDTVVTVLDEAYFEYGRGVGDYPDGLEFVREGRNVVVLRTFSKAYGLAGLRLGYAFAGPDIVDAMDRAREPFNVNSLAQAAAVAALADQAHVEDGVARNSAGLQRIERAAAQMGLRTIPSLANFVVVHLGRPAGPVFQELLKRGVIVRSGEVLGLPGSIRVSVGTEDEVERFLQAFEEVMKVEVPA